MPLPHLAIPLICLGSGVLVVSVAAVIYLEWKDAINEARRRDSGRARSLEEPIAAVPLRPTPSGMRRRSILSGKEDKVGWMPLNDEDQFRIDSDRPPSPDDLETQSTARTVTPPPAPSGLAAPPSRLQDHSRTTSFDSEGTAPLFSPMSSPPMLSDAADSPSWSMVTRLEQEVPDDATSHTGSGWSMMGSEPEWEKMERVDSGHGEVPQKGNLGSLGLVGATALGSKI
ncbi:hypothetical protein T439DRAFT_355539 [Meredithblackwellia eburnea MCA 4105]